MENDPSMRLSDAEALIENMVREQVPEIADGWYWGTVDGKSGARGSDHRSLYAYWRIDADRSAAIAPRMETLRRKVETLDAVSAVHVREYQPETGYSGPPQLGQQWEIRLNLPVG